MHPDITELVWKYGRAHHYVDYSVFSHLGLVKDESYTPRDFSKVKLSKVPVTEKISLSSK
jgi:hypothetical protein